MGYLDSLDIGNRALQHCGLEPVLSVTEDSGRNKHAAFAYDKVRKAELRRNVWRFATRLAVLRPLTTTTMLLSPAAWDATKTYLPGAIVADTNDELWSSNKSENINNAPGDTAVWEKYFGPMSVSLYDSTIAYYVGEMVYKANGIPGGYNVFMSLKNTNTDVPDVATAYDATVTYSKGDVVSSGGSNWRSLIEFNLGTTPADGPLAYDNTATYSTGNTVTGSDNYIYSSVGSGNIGHDPTTDGGVHWTNTDVPNAWSRTPTITTAASVNWRLVQATIINPRLLYPIGTGPEEDNSTLNVFRLPAGFLKQAPQDPKAGSTSYLGAPSARMYDDWEFQGNYITSTESSVIVFRFVADIIDVQQFDDMFCEGLALRVALAISKPLNQSATRIQELASEYKLMMGEARLTNAIENDPVQPPEDDFITCRI